MPKPDCVTSPSPKCLRATHIILANCSIADHDLVNAIQMILLVRAWSHKGCPLLADSCETGVCATNTVRILEQTVLT